jgi:hypothetical protein
MPKFYNKETGEIVDYPAEAAALFDVLKPVPSEREPKPVVEAKPSEPKTPAKKNGEVENAK